MRRFSGLAILVLAGAIACDGTSGNGVVDTSDGTLPTDLPVVFDRLASEGTDGQGDSGQDAPPPADAPGTPDADGTPDTTETFEDGAVDEAPPESAPELVPEDISETIPADPGQSDAASDAEAEVFRECIRHADCAGKVTLDGPCERPVCDDKTFTCGKGLVYADTRCDDGNPCTEGESCDEKGVCGEGVNSCDCLADADCEARDDDNLCNGILVCDLVRMPHKCVVRSGSVISCPSATDCIEKVCVPATGDCEDRPRNEDLPCDDGEPCTVGEQCKSGVCLGGTAPSCDDRKECTTDRCVDGEGCRNEPITGGCDDGNQCTIGDTCQAGACVPGTARVCSDDQVCTDDTCDPLTGCVFRDNTLDCDDGNACTVGDACAEGECSAGSPKDCDDDDACTEDACVAGTGACSHTPRSGGVEGPRGTASCRDGDDDDCDGLEDLADPDCRLVITALDPASGPTDEKVPVAILGDGFDDVVVARFDGILAVELSRTATRLEVLAPTHAAGAVGVTVSSSRTTVTSPVPYQYTVVTEDVEWGILQHVSAAEVTEGGAPATVSIRAYHPGLTGAGKDPSSIRAQACFGPAGTLPWLAAGWNCEDALLNPACLDCGNNAEWQFAGAVAGGVYDVFARFSLDGSRWMYADLDGNDTNQGGTNGCTSDQAFHLTVWGVPAAGDVVINELMWMGTNVGGGAPLEGPADEFIELRNRTSKPFRLAGWIISGAKTSSANLALVDAAYTITTDRIGPNALLLIARKAKPNTAIGVDPAIVASGMELANALSRTYVLMTQATGGVTLDTVYTTDDPNCCGDNGDQDGKGEDRSMERNLLPGDGATKAAWHTADCKRGWAGAGNLDDNGHNWGTPGNPNCDVDIP